jgi:hypothetical protein
MISVASPQLQMLSLSQAPKPRDSVGSFQSRALMDGRGTVVPQGYLQKIATPHHAG